MSVFSPPLLPIGGATEVFFILAAFAACLPLEVDFPRYRGKMSPQVTKGGPFRGERKGAERSEADEVVKRKTEGCLRSRVQILSVSRRRKTDRLSRPDDI